MTEHHEHLEIVETPGLDQPWHNRIVAGNQLTSWGTEQFHHEDSARDSLLALGRMFSPVFKATVNEHELWVWLDEDELGAKLIVPIRHVTNPDQPTAGGKDTEQITAVRELVAGWKRAVDVDAVSPQQLVASNTLGHVITEIENVVGEVTP